MMDHFELHKLKTTLLEFSERNRTAETFSEDDFVTTFNSITPFVKAFPVSFDQFEMMRSRRISYATDLENLKQMGPPPSHRVTKIGRCNYAGHSILYGASNLSTSFLEIGLNDTEPCAISVILRLRHGQQLTLWPIGELDHYRRHRRTRLGIVGIEKLIVDFVKPLQPYENLAFDFVDSYLADFFSRSIESDRNLYEVSARIAEAFMRVDGIDGIIYPSVKHQGGLNFAIKAELFDTKFEVTRFSLTTPIRHIGYGLFEYFEHAYGTHLNERGDFIWQGNPHFNARATIPLSAES